MLTAAVVGCGPRGVDHARALQTVEGIALVGAVDLDPARRTAAGAALGIPVSATVDELRARARPDIVVLATPASMRLALVEAVLREGGVRALVLEKPMAAGLADARRIVDLCDRAGVQAVVGHQLRFCPEFVALKEAVDRGELGRLQSLAGWCYGNLLNQGPHLLDMARWLAGGRQVLWVMSQRSADRDALQRYTSGSAPPWDDAAHPAPPWMVHHVAFDDGLRATIETGPLHQRSGVFVDDWLQQRMRVVGSEGLAEAQAAGYFKLLRDGSARREFAGTLAGYQSATVRFHEELRDTLLHGGTHRNGARQALASFEVLAACAQSAVDGGIATWPLDGGRDALGQLAAGRAVRRAPGPRAAGGGSDEGPVPHGGLEFSILLPLPDHRGHALDSVRSWTHEQIYPRERYELIVVGNGSEPDLEEAVRALLGPSDRLLRLATTNELALYHHATEAARGRWLLFTEAHCIAEWDCLAELAAYLERQPCAGACLRSANGDPALMARLEERMFREGFAEWSRPGDWRKVIMRGFALRADVYREVGGFEHGFERFAEWALASTLHARGFALGYAAGSAVTHFDTASYAQLFPTVASFTRGEMAYRAARSAQHCQRYFGEAPEWPHRYRLDRDLAREAMRAAWRGLWGDGWRAHPRGIQFALAMARQVLASVPTAVFGARLHVGRARLGLGLARLRLACPSGGEARYRAYRRLWEAMVHFARIDYLARHGTRRGVPADPELHVDVGRLPDDRLAGFHQPETWEGRAFRWMGAVGTMRLHVPRGRHEVRLDTGGLMGSGPRRPVAVFWNGHPVSGGVIRQGDGRLSFPLAPEWFASGPEQTLTLACAPVWRSQPAERRRLGLPVFSVTFAPEPP